MTRPDLVPALLDVTIDPCDGSVAPSLQYILIRGFTAMGWEQPKAASEDMAVAILEMIRPSGKPHPMDQGLRRTQETMTIAWLRDLAAKGGRGVVNNIDARCLGRIADEIERLTALNNKLTEDFNTLALDRSQWQDRAENAQAGLRSWFTEINKKITTDLTALALDWQERAEKLSLALQAEQAINKDLKIELDEARADIEASISDFKVAGGKLSEAQDELSKLRAMLETVHGKFCTIAAGEAWTDTCLDGYRKTPGGLREFAESAAKEIDLSIEAGTARD